MRRKGIFSETNVYFYLHNEHDRDVIEQVKIGAWGYPNKA